MWKKPCGPSEMHGSHLATCEKSWEGQMAKKEGGLRWMAIQKEGRNKRKRMRRGEKRK